MIAIDLSKQQALNVDPRAIQQITIAGNLGGNTAFFKFVKKQKKLFWTFHKELFQKEILVNVLQNNLMWFDIIKIWNDSIWNDSNFKCKAIKFTA